MVISRTVTTTTAEARSRALEVRVNPNEYVMHLLCGPTTTPAATFACVRWWA